MREETKRTPKGALLTDDGKSERSNMTDEAGEPTRGTPSRKGERRATEPPDGKAPGKRAPTSVSTRIERIAKRAKERPQEVVTTLNHFIDIEWLKEAYRRTRKDGAVGIDGQTAKAYEANLNENLASLCERLKSGRYFAPPVRRAHIPKGDGSKTRPIGIPTFEDKVLQRAVAMALEAVYEQDFRSCSWGFRPRRSQHPALADLREATMKMGGGTVIEVDIQGFFDALDHGQLRAFLDLRVRDGVLRRAIDKWLKAGVLDEGRITHPERGTPQGGVISPLLANIYLHHVIDVWFEDEIKPRLSARAHLARYADDIVIVLESEKDARRVMDVLPKRFGKYGLTLHPEKTKLVRFRRPRVSRVGKGQDGDDDTRPGTFPFLGFTHHWARSRKGVFVVKRKTAADRLRRALKAMNAFCRKARHWPVRKQHAALVAKVRGHYQYYGITANIRALSSFLWHVERIWRSWLNRRSQRRSMSWRRFAFLKKRYPLPTPVIVHLALRHAANP